MRDEAASVEERRLVGLRVPVGDAEPRCGNISPKKYTYVASKNG
jgi:hypothetical protein